MRSSARIRARRVNASKTGLRNRVVKPRQVGGDLPIRKGNPADYQVCAQIDRSYTTAHVWQMDERMAGDEITISFRPIRLPRPLPVPQTETEPFLQYLQRAELFLVADENGEQVGYLGLTTSAEARTADVGVVAVGPQFRRRGVGTALLAEAKQWVHARRLQALVLETQTRNYPAIKLCQRAGFVFCGFNDRPYPSRDIAIRFVCST